MYISKPTCTVLRLNTCLHGDMPATYRLDHDKARICVRINVTFRNLCVEMSQLLTGHWLGDGILLSEVLLRLLKRQHYNKSTASPHFNSAVLTTIHNTESLILWTLFVIFYVKQTQHFENWMYSPRHVKVSGIYLLLLFRQIYFLKPDLLDNTPNFFIISFEYEKINEEQVGPLLNSTHIS